MVAYLPKWYRIDELTKLVQFVGVCRQGFNRESPYPSCGSTFLKSALVQRWCEQVRRGQSVRYLAPTMVDLYIKEHLLYRD